MKELDNFWIKTCLWRKKAYIYLGEVIELYR